MPEVHSFSLSEEGRREAEALSKTPAWKRFGGSDIPNLLPVKLRARTVEVVAVSAPASTGGTVLMLNVYRADARASKFDEQPVLILVNSTGASTFAVSIDHADHEGRSAAFVLPEDFGSEVTSSGIANYYRSLPPLGSTGGPLSTLPAGDRSAFERAMELLRFEAAPKSTG